MESVKNIEHCADIINVIKNKRKDCQEGKVFVTAMTGRNIGGKIMEDNRAEQIEALEVLAEFNERLVHNMEIIVKELSGERLDDTDKFLKSIIDAMNWEIQVVNGTMGLLNEDEERVDKVAFNDSIVALSAAINQKDDAKMAEEFKKVIPTFRQLGESAKEVIR